MKRSLETISAPPIDGIEKIDEDENLVPVTATTTTVEAIVAVAAVPSIKAEAAADDIVPVTMVTDEDIQKDDNDGEDGSPKRQRARLE